MKLWVLVGLALLGGCQEPEFLLQCGALATRNEPDGTFLDGDAICGAVVGPGDVDTWQSVNETGSEADLVLTFDTFYTQDVDSLIGCPAFSVTSRSPGIFANDASCTVVRVGPIPDGETITISLDGIEGEYFAAVEFQPLN